MKHHRHAELRCRICAYKLDAATCVDPDFPNPPSDGDFSVCQGCGEISIFEVTGGNVTGLREPNFIELTNIYQEHRVLLERFTRLRAQRPTQ